jgi:hypothetical protein
LVELKSICLQQVVAKEKEGKDDVNNFKQMSEF